jgi:hypothetical protein
MSEDLIYAMSTRGSVTFEEFNLLFRMVYAPGLADRKDSMDIDIRRQLIRLLDSLGYCEFDFGARRVYMCEPSFVLLPSYGLPKAVFTGARTPQLIKKIKENVRPSKDKMMIHYVSQNTFEFAMPALVYIEAVNIEAIKNLADKCSIAADLDQPAAWSLASFSVSSDEILKTANLRPFAGLNWKRRVFCADRLVFSGQESNPQESMTLVEYKNPISQQSKHMLMINDSAAEIDRDWGRYIALSNKKKQIILYNEKLQKLIVPVTVPMPRLLARSVALCTGLAPKITTILAKIGDIPPNHPVYVYSGVPGIVAEFLARKLGQDIYYSGFDFNDKGAIDD